MQSNNGLESRELLKPSDLRIGNYVHVDGFGPTVVRLMTMFQGEYEVYHNQSDVLSWSNSAKFDKVEPIPLTEEWLIRFGFKKGLRSFFIGHTDFTYHLESKADAGFTDGGYFMGIRYDDWDNDPETIHKFTYDIHYVHQLMNIYFSLTNSELEIKR
jgi:hypothetical protein